MADFVDFDAAWAERQAQREAEGKPAPRPLRVKAFDEVWELPASVPAAAIIWIARLKGGSMRDLTGPEMIDLGARLIPDDVLEGWFANGCTEEQLGDLIGVVWSLYNGGVGQGEAQAPATGAQPANRSSRRSSTAGARSKRTSNASTRRTSTT